MTALSALPPAPRTPTTANCDAPVKANRDKTQACSTERSASTAAAPKAIPYTPTVRATLRESRSMARDTHVSCPIGG
ncbi:unannotated protein [freshwater metagenome]|uniref:Unannotated protein n=1 Tax=freshwater metagenome TaxID=449393 RepID=A0A6J7S564_9ZZZZ